MATRDFYTLIGALTLACVMVLANAAHAADTLCPDTTKLKDLSLGDVMDLQFDIDRLNLCLQRAKLLEELDETVKKREQIRQEPLVPVKNMDAAGGTGSGPFSNVPVLPAMPALPEVTQAVASTTRSAPAAAPVASSDWKVQRIWGQGSAMQAQLVQGDMIANVKLNDVLPSGEKITELSGRGVTVDDAKGKHLLKWLETVKKTGRPGTGASS